MDLKESEKKLTKLLTTLKKNRDQVPLEVLQTRYRTPYIKLCREIWDVCASYMTAACFREFRCNTLYWEECKKILLKAKQDSGIIPQIHEALYQRQNIEEVRELTEKLHKVYLDALEPFYAAHSCLLITEECLEEPPAIPPLYNKVTGYFYEDGAWVEKPKGTPEMLTHIQQMLETLAY